VTFLIILSVCIDAAVVVARSSLILNLTPYKYREMLKNVIYVFALPF
jgi:hypothetical protein